MHNRVELGGHDITNDVILFNHDEGIRRVCENLHIYDTVTFIDTARLYPETVTAYRKQTNNLIVHRDHIDWFNNHFSKPLKKLVIGKKPKPNPRLRKRRGPRL